MKNQTIIDQIEAVLGIHLPPSYPTLVSDFLEGALEGVTVYDVTRAISDDLGFARSLESYKVYVILLAAKHGTVDTSSVMAVIAADKKL